ncbi:hypothetical protein GWI33_002883 [Rhynchophorus ferrugineus]|uniref:Uncharacterized protein n=1 Tax=Rhynchophorus ferrugineus TaxID=354439 RepID=A0A834IJX9_RHYFE|nr:hypothetical protein GWI33_002883 [Rhynchophorus ferrugineus]
MFHLNEVTSEESPPRQICTSCSESRHRLPPAPSLPRHPHPSKYRQVGFCTIVLLSNKAIFRPESRQRSHSPPPLPPLADRIPPSRPEGREKRAEIVGSLTSSADREID